MKSLSARGAAHPCFRVSYPHLRIFFLSVFLASISISAHALDYFWVGGSGMWSDHNNHWATSSGGNVFHDQVPQSMDNVHFDVNSFPSGGTVTIDQTIIYCMDMDWAGATGTPVFEGPADKQVWIYGSLSLISGMEWAVWGEVHFRAFQTGKTITSAGKEFPSSVFFDGSGGEWTLLDALWVHKYLEHLEGALYTNGQDVKVDYGFTSNGSLLNFGNSNIYLTGIDIQCPSFVIGGVQVNFDAGSSTIYIQSPMINCGDRFIGGDHTFYNVVFEVPTDVYGNNNFHSVTFLKNAQIFGNNHYDILTFTAGQVYKLASGSKQTINSGGTLNGNGSCMDFLTILSQSVGNSAQIEKTTGTVDLNYIVLQDVHAIGGAAFTAASSADLGNNTGWTFLSATPRNLYWVSGGGDWNDEAHWSLSSGGTNGECIPTPFDNVFFDQNSGFILPGEQVNINVPLVFCQDMDWTSVPNSPVLTGTQQNKMFVFGSLKFVPEMTLSFYGEVHFMAHTSGKTIVSSGKEFLTDVFFEGASGGWTLLDAFRVLASIQHNDGALYTNGQDVIVRYHFISQGSPNRRLHLGNSNIYIGEIGFFGSRMDMGFEPFILDAGTSTIYMKSPAWCNGCGGYFVGGNQTYYNLVCEEPTGVYHDNNFHSATFLKRTIIFGSNHYDNLTFTNGQLCELAAGSTQTINPSGTLNADGSCMDLLTIISTPVGSTAQIEKTTGTVNLSYTVLQDIHAIGGAIFSAANSADLSNNAGWVFLPTTPRNLYWVGGGGMWNSVSHWALASGGVGGECIPTPFDNVFFDHNSGFTMLGEQVDINVSVAFCQDMNWTGVANLPVLSGGFFNNIYIFGSLKFVPEMTRGFYGAVHFMAHTSGKTITSSGKGFHNLVVFDGVGGGWTLLDAFQSGYIVQHTDGALYTNGQDISVAYQLISQGSPTRTLHFGSSNIYIGGGGYDGLINIGFEPDVLDAGTSTVYMKGGLVQCNGCRPWFYGGNQTYYNLVCEVPTDVFNDNNFHSATFLKGAKINGSNVFESLTFSPGSTYEIAATSTQTITPLGNFIAEGSGSFPIEIKSTNLGQQATIHKDGDPICLDFLYLTDIAATGTGFRYAGANSDNVSNNSGWLFEACPGCFNDPAAPAPALDPASVINLQPGQQATLIFANLPNNSEAVWFNADQTTELYASADNNFQPVINQGTKFYGAYRDLGTGCVSDVLEVLICPEISFTLIPTPPVCIGGSNGSLEVTNVQGLGSPVTYTISGGGSQNSPLFTGLSAGTYTVTVSDASLCSASQTAVLPDGSVDGQSLSITCPGSIPNLQGGSNCQATLGDYTGLAIVTGNCGGPLYPVVQTPPAGTLVNPGTVALHLTVSNTLGESVSCVFNVGILGGCH